MTVLPGPSAVETALVASGLAGERYRFLGYLPRGEAALAALWEELAAWAWPAVAFESPQRLPASLRSLAAAAPERQVAVCRELTKRFEEVVRGSAARARASGSPSRRRARSRSCSGGAAGVEPRRAQRARGRGRARRGGRAGGRRREVVSRLTGVPGTGSTGRSL